MNIFETIGRVSRRYEPYHSQFLTDGLESSLNDSLTCGYKANVTTGSEQHTGSTRVG